MTIEQLETLEPTEAADLLARCRDEVNLSKGFAIYGGDTREAIVTRYNLVRAFIISKLSDSMFKDGKETV